MIQICRKDKEKVYEAIRRKENSDAQQKCHSPI